MRIYPLKTPINSVVKGIAADKSISHRAAIFSLLSDKTSKIKNYLRASDTLNTLNIISSLGAKIDDINGELYISPPKNIKEPNSVLECGNSGTAMRIMLGFLASVDGFFVLSGDRYLNKRPMRRVIDPLSEVGAKFDGVKNGEFAPICVRGKKLDYFEYKSGVSSAQVKTAMILAGLMSRGCKFSEPNLSRNHSEIMLLNMGAQIFKNNLEISVKPLKKPLNPLNISVPNDPSSAFFFAVAACITPNSKIVLKDILLNETRIEAFNILKEMGAKIDIKVVSNEYEKIGDIYVEYSNLKAVEVSKNISWLIDEAPALAVAFAFANGKSVLKNAKELRVKECDRIEAIVSNLKACGVKANELDDGFEVVGSEPKFGNIKSYGDHRIAMSFAILGLKNGVIIDDSECINVSFPNFKSILKDIGAKIED